MAIVALSAAVGVGCSSEDSKSGDPPSGAFASGEYLLTATEIDVDECLDGTAELAAFPDGAGTTREFTNPLSFPGSADTSHDATLALVAPFTETSVTFSQSAANTWIWDPKPGNTGVELGDLVEDWRPCLADFEFGGEWNAEQLGDGTVRFTGTASFHVQSATGAGCPAWQLAPPCEVRLKMIASPKQ